MTTPLPLLFSHLAGKSVLLVGDFYLDEQIRGRITGMSAEGPYPRIAIESRVHQPGAAGHVAMLLNEWGIRVKVAGFIGDDPAGIALRREFDERQIDTKTLLAIRGSSTRGQIRIAVQGDHYPQQEIVRLDAPASDPVANELIDTLFGQIKSVLPGFDALVVVEKERSFLTASRLQPLVQLAHEHGVRLVGDSERQLYLFEDFDAITPNEREVLAAVPEEQEIQGAARLLQSRLECRSIFVSLGRRGLLVAGSEGKTEHIATTIQPVFDVTGAGETVVAAVAAGFLADLDPRETARLANLLAGLAVTRPGLTRLPIEIIQQAERRQEAQAQANKIVAEPELVEIVRRAQTQGKRVVWTNGCYDLVHAGHILYLEKARALGDLLVLGLNSDASVRLSKGPNRPIVNQEQRARLMSALSCVDQVIIFDDESPLKIIDRLRPDIYAKGGDYTVDTINQDERRLVEGYGGRIALLPGVEGMSTTHLIERILKTYRDQDD